MIDCELVYSPLYPNYRFTSDGKIYSKYHKEQWKEMKPFINTDHSKYLRIRIKNDQGKFRKEYVHRIIAKVFVPNPENLPYINHKDENKYNNNATNLEWCTAAYNNSYGHHIQNCRAGVLKSAAKKRIAIIGTDSLGKEHFFNSLTEAAKTVSCSSPNIGKCLKGERKSAGGYTWKKK